MHQGERLKFHGVPGDRVTVKVYEFAGYTDVDIIEAVEYKASSQRGLIIRRAGSKRGRVMVVPERYVEVGGVVYGIDFGTVFEFPSPEMRGRFETASRRNPRKSLLERFNLSRIAGSLKRRISKKKK